MNEPRPNTDRSGEPPAPPSAPSAVWRRRGPLLAAVWILSAVYLLVFVDRGWIPSDEGVLGQTAERVLRGELPNVDFHDVYTGGLAVWHALAFHLLGLDLLSIRWFLYLATLLFVPVVFAIASRMAPPLGAAGMTLLAVVWSVPNYFAGMPSWYNLFLAAGAVLALLRYVESARRRWLLLAGLAAGSSFLAKSAGLLLIAAVLLFLVFREQEVDALAAADGEPSRWGLFAFRALITLGLASFVAVLVRFVGQRPGPMEILHHVLPGGALAALLTARVWRRPSGPVAARLGRLAGDGLVFAAGVLLPIAAFLVPYARRGVIARWATSGFLFQASRLEMGVWALPGPATLVCAVPLALLFAWPLWREHRGRPPERRRGGAPRRAVGAVALVAALALATASNHFVYQTIWFSLRPLVPITAVVGALVLARRPEAGPGASRRRQQLFLLLAVASLAAIVQFPFARAVYFCYVAPLVALAWLFLARQQRQAPRALHAVAGVFFGLFAALWLNFGWIEAMERQFLPLRHATPLALDRATLHVSAGSAASYQGLVAVVQRLSGADEAIFATPDCPEVYFLTARRNPTPTLLDFLDDDFGTPERTARLLRMLEQQAVDVVVLREVRLFTPLDQGFAAAIGRRYPRWVEVWPYSVHWRDRGGEADGPPVHHP